MDITNSLLRFREIAITAEKNRLQNLLTKYSDHYTINMIETFQSTLQDQEKKFEKAMQNAEQYKKFDDLYEQYVNSAKHQYNTITEDTRRKITELEEKINN